MDQVRPTTALIDLDALAENFRQVRGHVGPQVGIACAVKGDAYGHGAVAVARTLEAAGADWFAVALVEEGIALRTAGVTRPILCLGGVGLSGAEAALRWRLTPVVSSLADAELLDAAAARRHEPVGIHLKIDTGMGRLGVPLPRWGDFLDRLAAFRWLRVDGACSHLSESGALDEGARVHTREQGRRFLTAVQAARGRGFRPALLHVANSGAILTRPSMALDLVRPGLLLYGYSPISPEPPLALRPVMSVRTRVLLVRDLPAGVGVSYGRTWHSARPTRLATLPLGYADGYPRALSGHAEVLIAGHRAPVRGRICMDLCMVDVTDIPVAVRPGDAVVVMGTDQGERIDAWELATWAGTIPYEILAGFSERVPRRSITNTQTAAGTSGSSAPRD